MGRGHVRCGFAAGVIATLVLVVLTAAAAPASAREEPATVFSHFEFDADRSGQVKVTEGTRLRLSAADGRARRFLAGGPEDADATEVRRWLRAREWIAADLGLFSYLFYEEPVSLDSVEVERGHLLAEAELTQGEDDDREGREEEGDGQWFGPFHLGWRDGARLVSAIPNPAAVRWVVSVEVDQATVQSINPPPTVLNRDGSHTTLIWRFPPGDAAPVRIDLDPPWAVVLATDDGGGWTAVRIAAYLVVVLLFLPVLFLLLRRRDLRGAFPDSPLLGRQLNRLLIAAAALLGVAVTIWVVTEAPKWFGDYSRWSPPPRIFVSSLAGLLATIAAAAVCAAGRPRSAWRWIVPVWALVAATVVMTNVRVEAIDFEGTPATWDLVLTGLDGLALALVCFGLFGGLARVGLSWLESGRSRSSFGAPWRPRADLPALLLTLALLAIMLNNLGGRLGDVALPFGLLYETPALIVNLAIVIAPLMALALLPAAFRLLDDTDRPAPFLVSQRGRWLLAISLFLLFVVPSYGPLAEILVPMPLLAGGATFAALAVIRLVRLERLEREVALRNQGPDRLEETRLLTGNSREIVDRALLIERLQRERRGLHRREEEDAEWVEEYAAERGGLAGFDAAEQFLQTGDPPPGVKPSRADRGTVALRFPPAPPLLYPALGCGPAADWRGNGRIALRHGAWLALLPLAFFIFTLLRNDLDEVLHSELGTEPLLLLGSVGWELAFWLVAAYVFGCLFTWLPGANGGLKGLVLSLPVAVAVAAMSLCPVFQVDPDMTLRPFVLLLFLSLLGLLLDYRTVRGVGLRARSLAELYQVRSVRFGLVNLVPLVIAAVGIYQGLQAGNPQEAIENAIKSAPQQIPGADGEGAGGG